MGESCQDAGTGKASLSRIQELRKHPQELTNKYIKLRGFCMAEEPMQGRDSSGVGRNSASYSSNSELISRICKELTCKSEAVCHP